MESASAPARAEPTVPPRPTSPPSIAVPDIPAEAASVDALRYDIAALLQPGPELADADGQISALEQWVEQLRKRRAL
ncbi:MAG: hypothetical protein ACRD3M_15585, partial [Thermoanaerobaculia bacterium]